MILFKPAMVPLILSGQKTVTRRRGKCRWRVGAIHQAYTRPAFARPPGQPFARVRIVSVVREERLGDAVIYLVHDWQRGSALEEDALREGFLSWPAFLNAWAGMHGESGIDEPCWRVEFELVEAMG